jgi:flagellin-specific chaperone FliS
MRRLTISIFVIIVTVTLCAAVKEQTVDELKSRVESARPEDRPALCIQIARQQLRNADQLYNDGKVEQARAAVDDIVAYSEKAHDAATQTKKHQKNVEIAVRKMSEKLRDIKRTLAFEDQSPVDRAIKRLEDIRTALLQEMFSKDKK